MDIQQVCFKRNVWARFLSNWLLILLILAPLSCSAQKNALTRISSVERSDNKGHVIRFHLASSASSFDFSQPRNHLVQFQIKGNGISTSDIHIDDQSNVIKNIDFYSISGGIGIDIFLEEDSFYKADAYPDRNGRDMLLALTKTSQKNLAQHILDMQPFAWSDAEISDPSLADNADGDKPAAIDTSYQQIKDKIKFDVVVLDPGHGGHDVGAIGGGHTYEKKIALDIAKKVGGYINKYLPDVKVVYTRDSDEFIELEERGSIANRSEGDLFVSIHCNSAGASQAHGAETYFLGLERSQTALEVMKRENSVVDLENGDSKRKLSQEDLIIYELANSGYIASSERIAGMIQQQFRDRAKRRSRGVKQARFVVLYHASMPAVLVETGFISNPNERNYLTSNYGQSIIASAIFRAIRNYKGQFEKSQHFNTNETK